MSGKRAAELAASLAASVNAATGIRKGAGYGVSVADMLPVASQLVRTERMMTKALKTHRKQQRRIAKLCESMIPATAPPSVATIEDRANWESLQRLRALTPNGFDRRLPTTNGRADAPPQHEG